MKRTLTLLSAITLGALLVTSAALADDTHKAAKPTKHHVVKAHKATKKTSAKTGKMSKKTAKVTKTANTAKPATKAKAWKKAAK